MTIMQTIPMGFVTIVTGIALLGHDYGISGGLTPILIASGCWWAALGTMVFIYHVRHGSLS